MKLAELKQVLKVFPDITVGQFGKYFSGGMENGIKDFMQITHYFDFLELLKCTKKIKKAI